MSAPSSLPAAIAITGIGALTPLGDSPDAVFAALLEGRTAVAPAADQGGVGIAAIAGFDYAKYVQVRGMRMYNRATQMAICATKLALTDSKIDTATLPGEELGLLMGSTYGHIDVLIDYDRSLVANGVQRTNGALMPLAIPSAPGAMVALAFGAKAFSMTLSDGGSSWIDCAGLAARWLAEKRARVCIVTSGFSASPELVLAATRAGILAPSGEPRPFDKRASGAALGQAAVTFILERADDAAARGARVRGYMRGYGGGFAGKASELAGALERAATGALLAAGAPKDRVGLVSSGGSGVAALDRAEAEGISRALGERARHAPVIAVKTGLGDALDTAGALQAMVALTSLEQKTAPSIARLEEPQVTGLRYATKQEPVDGAFALVTSVSHSGTASALLLSDASQAS